MLSARCCCCFWCGCRRRCAAADAAAGMGCCHPACRPQPHDAPRAAATLMAACRRELASAGARGTAPAAAACQVSGARCCRRQHDAVPGAAAAAASSTAAAAVVAAGCCPCCKAACHAPGLHLCCHLIIRHQGQVVDGSQAKSLVPHGQARLPCVAAADGSMRQRSVGAVSALQSTAAEKHNKPPSLAQISATQAARTHAPS